MTRLEQLQKMLQKQPNDPFLLYCIGMEYKKSGDLPQALTFLDQTIAADQNYCYAYFQKGQVLEMQENPSVAKVVYQQGIDAATRAGDTHAASELRGAMEMLG